MANSACLTGNAAACNAADNIILIGSAGENERLTNDELECFKTEVIVNISVVNGNLSGTCIKTNTGNRTFSSACSVEIRLCFKNCFCLPS